MSSSSNVTKLTLTSKLVVTFFFDQAHVELTFTCNGVEFLFGHCDQDFFFFTMTSHILAYYCFNLLIATLILLPK